MKKSYKIFLYSLYIFLLCVCASSAFAQTDIYDGLISEDTIWTKDASPYVLYTDLVIDPEVTLTIEPGTIIKSDYGWGIYVQGNLITNGTLGEKVYFTSLYDDSVGGDTDLYEDLIIPYDTDWAGIYIFSGGSVEMASSVISYAEDGIIQDSSTGKISYVDIINCQNAISLTNNSILDIENLVIENISGDALFLYQNSTSTIKNSSVNIVGGDLARVFYNSYLSFEDSDIKNITGQVLYMYGQSNANIKNSNIEDSNDGILFYNNSNLDIYNSNIKNVSSRDSWTPFLYFYNGSHLNFLNSTLQNISGTAIKAYGNSGIYATTTLNISSSNISDGNSIGLQIYGNKFEANISKSKVQNFSEDGIQTFSYPFINITESEITGNNNGIVSWGSNIEIKDSIIYGNATYGISNNPIQSGAPSIKAINNWWGDKSGPYNTNLNASGTANAVTSNVAIQPWLNWDPRVLRRTPVIIVPGVMGTELKDDTQLLWLNLEKMLTDIGDDFLDSLSFSEGLEPENKIETLGVIGLKDMYGYKVYDYNYGLRNNFLLQNYTEGASSDATLFTFPYDWRYGVTGINLDGKTAADLLKEKIKEVQDQTGFESVDVIAHSTGGLIVKKYVIDNPDDHKINKAVFVGVPNTGAPKAVKALIQGDNFGIPWLSSTEMKKISKNFPVVYDLLPSKKYYDIKGSYIKIINEIFMKDTTINDLNYSDTESFLIENYSLNSQAIANAKNLHTQNFDDFDMRKAGIDLYSVNGCKAGTLGKIIEVQHTGYGGRKSIYYNKPVEVPGDGTVPLESSTNLPIDQDHKYYSLETEHGEMMSQDGIKEIITNIISGSQLSIDDELITQDISKCKLNGKAISVFSPVILDVTDQDGNHSGITIDGDVVNDIPNADVQVWNDHKFIYLPTDDGQTYTVNMKGTGKGTYTIKSDFLVDGQTAKTDTFTDLPVTSELTGSIDISGDMTTLFVKATPESQVEIIKPDSYKVQNVPIQKLGGAGSSLLIQDTATRPVVVPTAKELISTTINKEIKLSTSTVAVKTLNNNVQKTKVTKNNNKPIYKQVATVATVDISVKTYNYFIGFIKKIIFFLKK